VSKGVGRACGRMRTAMWAVVKGVNDYVAVLEGERDTWRSQCLAEHARATGLDSNLEALAKDHRRLEAAAAAAARLASADGAGSAAAAASATTTADAPAGPASAYVCAAATGRAVRVQCLWCGPDWGRACGAHRGTAAATAVAGAGAAADSDDEFFDALEASASTTTVQRLSVVAVERQASTATLALARAQGGAPTAPASAAVMALPEPSAPPTTVVGPVRRARLPSDKRYHGCAEGALAVPH
jgi:hypothetical protein